MPGFRASAGARALAAAAITTLVVTITALPAAASISGSVACGGLVAYSKQTGGQNTSRVMAVPAPGGTPRAIWDRAGEGEIDPAWSPDGRSIAFVGRTPAGTTPEGYPAADTRLYVLRPGAAEPEVVVEQFAQRGGLRFPTWSPDGTRIAYATGVPPEGQDYEFLSWVHVVDVATKTDSFLSGLPDPVVVPPEAPRFRVAPALTWSPRGDRLLITAWESPNTGNWTIFSAHPDPADPRLTPLISNDPSIKAGIIAQMPTMFPAFLPGGHAVLVEREEPDELSSRLYLTDTRFRQLVPVSAPAGWKTTPDFGLSPLQAVYQQSDGGNQTSIAVLTLPTGASRTLVKPAEGVYVERPDWQPVLGCHPWPFRS